MSIKVFFLGCLVVFSALLWGSDEGEFRGETKAKIEIFQKQNDELKTKIDAIEKDNQSIEEFKNTIDRQDKRIEDVNAKMGSAAEKTSWLAIIVGIWAVVATIASIIFPLVFVPKWKNEAITSARDAASQWLKDNSENLHNEINVFKERLDSLGNEVEENANHSNQKITSAADAFITKLQLKKEPSIQKKPPIQKKVSDDNDNADALTELAEQLRTKPQNEYNFEDWNRLAFSADEQRQKEDAIYYWNKAIEFGHPSEFNFVQTRLNIALTQGELNRFQEELSIYDDIIMQFENTHNEETKELLAEAFLNKGIRLGKLEGRADEAIAVYADLISRFKINLNESIDDSIALAMLNKGFELAKKGINDEAITIYRDLLNQFKGTVNESIRDTKLQALINLYELSIITGTNFDDTYTEQLKTLAGDDKATLNQYEMLKIIHNSLYKEQKEKIYELQQECSGKTLCDDWSWKELENWANYLEPEDVRIRVLSTIKEFKKWWEDSISSPV